MLKQAAKNNTALQLKTDWMKSWPGALELWGKFIRLPEPVFCADREEETREGLTGSFAMIRLTDHRIILSPKTIVEKNLGKFSREIMGHEIGHHVLCPADLADTGRMIARIRRGLPTVESYAPLVGNLYTDLLINDRLFRSHGLRMDEIYRRIADDGGDPLWNFYMRIYEILWAIPRGTLARGDITPEMEGDAQLGNRVVRAYAADWVRGAGRFAALCLPYLIKGVEKGAALNYILDANRAAGGEESPAGLAEIDDDELTGSEHPAMDNAGEEDLPGRNTRLGGSGKSYREPFEYGQILKSMGISLTDEQITARYYRERAVPYLVPFPSVESPRATDPLPEGLDLWDMGDPLDRINWIESALRSPVLIPGVTVYETHYGEERGFEKSIEPVDLDIYIDSSGSMPNPGMSMSFLALAGVIIVLSALRAGSRVQATLWSGPAEFKTTKGFITDEALILAVITGYIGGSTAFPIHTLRDTYEGRTPASRKAHILHISDDGITTMFDTDEKGNSGRDIAAMALERAGGGGSMALNLYSDWHADKQLVVAAGQGWEIYPVTDWSQLIEFGRAFTRRHYAKKISEKGAGYEA